MSDINRGSSILLIRFHSKILVILTTCVLLLILAFLFFFNKNDYEKPIPLYTVGQPSIGNPNAKVHVVDFQDPKCNNCIVYHNDDYQKLYENFIKTGLVRYTIYLVAELPNSYVIARLFFCVNSQSTDAFFNLLDLYYQNPSLALTEQELNTQLMRLVANSSLNINMNNLQQCTALHTFENQVIANTNYARDIMCGIVQTPTLFVNGIRLVRPTYKELQDLIQLELNKER